MKLIWKSFIILAILLITGAIIIGIRSNNQFKEQPRTATVELKKVVQEVFLTGRVTPKHSANIGFEYGGTLTNLSVEVGDTVTAGQVLAQLDPRLNSLELARANANTLSQQEAFYKKWQQAKENWENSKEHNTSLISKQRQNVRDSKRALDQAKEVRQQKVQEYGDESSVSKSAYSSVLLAETAYHAAQKTLQETIKSIKKNNDTAYSSMELAKSSYLSTVQASGQVAGLSSLQASQQIANTRLAKQTITAPFNGIVTAVNKELGEVALTGQAVVVIQTTDNLELVSDVSETDAVKLSKDMSAVVTLDAYQKDSWLASITHISPAEKMIEGVPTYEVKLKIETAPKNIKPGLTANITVHAREKNNVIAISRRAVVNKNNEQYVVIFTDGKTTERKIETGLTGSDGLIEIVSGLSVGEQVVIDASNLE